MKHDAVSLHVLPDFRLEVHLADGRRGIVDLKPHLASPGMAALKSPAYFERAAILYGAVTWPDGEDIAPDTLAAELLSLQPA